MATSSGFDWTGLLNAGVNYLASRSNATQNTNAAQNFANAVRFNPYNISAGNSGALFNGNNAIASLSPTYQNLQNQLTTGSSGFLGGLGTLSQNGGINPFLQGSFDTYNNAGDAVNLNPFAKATNPLSTSIGDQFNATSQGFLGGLGSFNPNQAASDYANNLRSQAAPGNQLAAENLAQGLFNSGRLGSTGGANLYGQLVQAQNQQDLQFQQAGRDYAGQEQNRLAGLAQGFGQLGTGINQSTAQLNDQFLNSGLNRGLSVNQYGNQRAQQRFANAMQLFGAGQQNLQNQYGMGLGLLQGSQGLDQNLLQAIQTGGYLGGASSNAAAVGGQQVLNSQVAGNNAGSAGLLGLLDSSGLLGKAGDWLNGLFGTSGNVSNTAPTPQPYNPSTGGGGGFNSAGGQAADTSGNGLIGGGYNFLGGAANIGNGLQDYSNIFSNSINGMDDQQLANYLGMSPDVLGGNNYSGLLNQGSDLLGIYNGIKQGGAAGYTNAAAGAADLAGVGGSVAPYAGIISNAAQGNYYGAGGAAVDAFLGGPYFAVANAVAEGLNHAFLGNASKDRNMAAFEQVNPLGLVPQNTVLGRTSWSGYYDPKSGKFFSRDYVNDLAGSWYGATYAPDGNQAEWAQKYQDFLNNPRYVNLPKGYHWDANTQKVTRD